MTKPNFFIVGAPKAATTSLYMYLYGLPKLYLPKMVKEPHFFSRNIFGDDNPRVIRDEAVYLDLFKEAKADDVAVGEASASYLADADTPRLIKEFQPEAKVIMMLRDPVTRAFSHYLMNFKRGRTKAGFAQEVRYELEIDKRPEGWRSSMGLHNGYYAKNVAEYLKVFDKEHYRIIYFEDFIKNTEPVVRDVIRFLGVPEPADLEVGKEFNTFSVSRGKWATYILNNETLKRFVRFLVPFALRDFIVEKFLTKKSAKPKIDEDSRALLIEHYRDEVAALEKLMGAKPPFPNF